MWVGSQEAPKHEGDCLAWVRARKWVKWQAGGIESDPEAQGEVVEDRDK